MTTIECLNNIVKKLLSDNEGKEKEELAQLIVEMVCRNLQDVGYLDSDLWEELK
jgi:hypothetical protein